MPEFNYQAKRQGESISQGRVHAATPADALALLQARGLEVVSIREMAPAPAQGTGSARELPWSPVPLASQAALYSQLGALLSAGVPIVRALGAVAEQTSAGQLRSIVRDLEAAVSAGGRMADAMERHRHVLGGLQIAMVRAGEAGGFLDQMLRRIADYLEREIALRRMINRSTLYPRIVAVVALFLLGGRFFGSMQPAIARLVLGGMGRDSYGGNDYLAETLLPLLIAAVAVLAIRTVISRGRGSDAGWAETWDRARLAIPVVGGIVQAYAAARFARALGALYGAGVPVADALRLAGEASGSQAMKLASQAAERMALQGSTVSACCAGSGLFGGMVVSMLRTGEETGNLDGMMSKAAEYLEGEATVRAHTAAHVFGTVVYLCVALAVGFAVISFWGAYAGGMGGGT